MRKPRKPVLFVTELTPHIMPPEESWLPGLLFRVPTLFADTGLHICLAGADVYPEGFIVAVEARFRRMLDFAEQKEVARQTGAHRIDGWEHDGPHLLYEFGDPPGGRPDRELPDAAPWGYGNAGRLWRLAYWVPFLGRSGADVRLVLSWPTQGVRAEHGYPRAALQAALAQARPLWPPG
jgi:hypothetical protein